MAIVTVNTIYDESIQNYPFIRKETLPLADHMLVGRSMGRSEFTFRGMDGAEFKIGNAIYEGGTSNGDACNPNYATDCLNGFEKTITPETPGRVDSKITDCEWETLTPGQKEQMKLRTNENIAIGEFTFALSTQTALFDEFVASNSADNPKKRLIQMARALKERDRRFNKNTLVGYVTPAVAEEFRFLGIECCDYQLATAEEIALVTRQVGFPVYEVQQEDLGTGIEMSVRVSQLQYFANNCYKELYDAYSEEQEAFLLKSRETMEAGTLEQESGLKSLYTPSLTATDVYQIVPEV